jgi:hypothetical protein
MSLRAEELDELMTLNRIYVASDAFDIGLALVTLALVNGVYRAQMTHVRVSSNNQMQRTCQKCHAFCLRKSRATFATPLI